MQPTKKHSNNSSSNSSIMSNQSIFLIWRYKHSLQWTSFPIKFLEHQILAKFAWLGPLSMSTKFSVLYIHLMLFVTMVDTLKVLFSYLYYEYVINEGSGHPWCQRWFCLTLRELSLFEVGQKFSVRKDILQTQESWRTAS